MRMKGSTAAVQAPPTAPRRSGPRVSRRSIGLALVGVALLGSMLAWTQRRKARPPVESPRALRPAPIDGDRAYAYLKQICDLGPRPAGSAANERQRALVAEHFRRLGATVREQPFTARDPLSGQPVAMANLIGSWFPERLERVVIAAHYDTRPHPDMEPDPRRRNDPFLGANDGASGVALLMEIAHHLKDMPTEWGVDLVLFDGEELVYDRVGKYFLGSEEFARQYKAARRSGKQRWRYSAGILLDMVGGKDLDLPREPYSVRFAGWLVRDIWGVAAQLGERAFRDGLGREVLDDHLAMNSGGIPTIDLIDFDYPQWHTASDTPEQCSPASLASVGRVVTAWLCKPKATLPRR